MRGPEGPDRCRTSAHRVVQWVLKRRHQAESQSFATRLQELSESTVESVRSDTFQWPSLVPMNGRDLKVRDGSILVVCTGNVCRSPYVERLLKARLARTGIGVSSAGTGALVGAEMDPQVAHRLAQFGADSADFVSRQLTGQMAADADLILCVTRHHRAQVVRMTPRALRRTYALADFSDLAARMVGVDIPARAGVGSFVRTISVSAEEARGDVQARTNEDAEIVDPFRQSEKVFEHMFSQVERFLPPIIAVLLGAVPEPISRTKQTPVI